MTYRIVRVWCLADCWAWVVADQYDYQHGGLHLRWSDAHRYLVSLSESPAGWASTG